MWNNDNFDGPSAGGFMDESYAQPSQSDQSKQESKAVKKNIKPMMISTLLSCDEKSSFIGSPISIIDIIAIVKKVETSATKVTYEIEDDSGSAVAYLMISTEDKQPKDVQTNKYYRIIGHVRNSTEKGQLIVIKMFPVTNYSQLLTFRMDFLLKMIAFEDQLDGITYDGEDDGGMNSNGTINSNMNGNSDVSNWSKEENASNGLSTDQMLIYKFIRDNDKDQGVFRDDIKNSMPDNMKPKVDDILTFLVAEGHIYTTCTDNHFQAT